MSKRLLFTGLSVLIIAVSGLLFLKLKSDAPHGEYGETDEQDNLQLAMEQEYRMAHDPATNTVPRERLLQAEATRQAMISSSRNVSAVTWTERGPSNVGGRVRSLVINRADATGNTVIAGGVSGGLWRTTNFKSAVPNWTPINNFMSNLNITSIIQDKTNNNVWYAGTGEGWFNSNAVRGAGIFKSTDGGNTWAQIPSTINFQYVQKIVQDNNNNLYAAIRNDDAVGLRGVQRSVDGGNTWTQVLALPLAGFSTGRAADLEVASNGDIYASLGIFSRGQIWKSTAATHGANTGAAGNWTNVTPTFSSTIFRIELACAPSNAQRALAICHDSASDVVTAIYRTNDGGSNWTSIPVPNTSSNGSTQVFTNDQAWFNIAVAFDPNNADNIVMGGLDLVRSKDAGNSWTQVAAWSLFGTTFTAANNIHADHHIVVFDGSNNCIVGTDGGLYYSQNIMNDPLPAFTEKNSNLNITQYYAADFHPTNANYFLAGAQDNGSHRLNAPGIATATSASGGDGGFCHIDQTDGQIQITSYVFNIFFFSTNGGTSFTRKQFNTSGQFINPTDYDDNLNVMYSGDVANRYNYINNIESGNPSLFFAPMSATMGGRQATAFKVDPNASGVLWIGCTAGNGAPQVIRVSNANSSTPTVQLNSVFSTMPNGSYVASIDVETGNSNHAVVTFSNYGVASVWETTNGGTTWTNIEGNLPDMPVRSALIIPNTVSLNTSGSPAGGIMLATETGIWSSSTINGAATVWAPDNGGMGNVRVDMIKYRASDRTVLAATHGRGLYTTTLSLASPTGVSNNSNTKNFIKYISADRNNLLITTGNLNTQTIDIQLFDMSGRMVLSNRNSYRSTSINIAGLPPGSYMVRITGNKQERYTQQFAKP
jgi:hypothetical protein